jgi:glyceraldehyde 3-phosphate dehydrogenase
VITGFSKDAPTFVVGVNEKDYRPEHTVVAMASCTTNCMAPLLHVLHARFGVAEALLTTVHSLTATNCKDSCAPPGAPSLKDWRAGGLNLIPSSTTASKATDRLIPSLKGKIRSVAFRVPTPDASLVDLTVRLARRASYDDVCGAVREEAEGAMKGVLGYSDADLVAAIGDSRSCIVDAKAGFALADNLVKLVAWYDNEWGYRYTVQSINLTPPLNEHCHVLFLYYELRP